MHALNETYVAHWALLAQPASALVLADAAPSQAMEKTFGVEVGKMIQVDAACLVRFDPDLDSVVKPPAAVGQHACTRVPEAHRSFLWDIRFHCDLPAQVCSSTWLADHRAEALAHDMPGWARLNKDI